MIVGSIVEYNPLHNGHIYHLNEIKKRNPSATIVLISSSNYTMRADLSFFDKFTKAKHALMAGCDLFLELPSVLSVNSADLFAYYSILFLNNAGCEKVYIGSENNDNTLYEKYYKVTSSFEFDNTLNEYIKTGLSYKNAYNMALSRFDLEPLKANDTLGLCYYKAIQKINKNIVLETIKRIGDDEEAKNNSTSLPNASFIRENFKKEYVPDFVYNDIDKKILNTNDIYLFVRGLNAIGKTYGTYFDEHGLAKYLSLKFKYDNINSFLDNSKSQRFTKAKIKRFLYYAALQITKDDIDKIKKEEINFIRVLGASQKGLEHLNKIKHGIIVYTNIKEGLNDILDIELRLTKLLDAIYDKDLFIQEQKFIIQK